MESQSARVAVIDDTDIVREMLARQLVRMGFTVVQAADGYQGLETIRSTTPELVICDLRMPNLDGLGLLKSVREEFPDLPVIVMSGEGLIQDAIGALKLGAWDYITKPVEMGALEHAVHKALEKAALIAENRQYRSNLEMLNRELEASLRLLAEDEAAGRQIQFRMLPRNHLSFGDFQFTRDVVPSTFLSGDFIDAFWIDQGHFGFYLADVSGHGVSSALVTVLLRTYVQRQAASFVRTGDSLVLSPARLLQGLNEEMARDELEKHLTIFYGVIDLRGNALLYANAGHFPWPILCDDGLAQVLEQPSVPIGMIPGTRYEEHRLSLSPRVCLSVFSDGILEALPQPTLPEKLEFLKEFFGRLDVSVEQARRELRLVDGAPLPDDVAILIIQRGVNHGHDATA
jgi:phosphoserine phosphatase RsbU/P